MGSLPEALQTGPGAATPSAQAGGDGRCAALLTPGQSSWEIFQSQRVVTDTKRGAGRLERPFGYPNHARRVAVCISI